MRKLLEVLRLSYEGNLSNRTIAKAVNLSRPTISTYLELFSTSGLTWPLDESLLNESVLSSKLKPGL